ncbi:MAG: DEAD/DEAH box helicase family protein [Cyanobacteria bacterium P01_A01_bin.84]
MPVIKPNYKPRDWQKEALLLLANKVKRGGSNFFLVDACPGSGKTYFGAFAFFILIKLFKGKINKVVCVSPKTTTKEGWSDSFLEVLDLGVDKTFSSETREHPSSCGFVGVSLTYAGLMSCVSNLSRYIDDKTLVILDEVHHLSEPKTRIQKVEDLSTLEPSKKVKKIVKRKEDKTAWSKAVELLYKNSGYVLSLSGTTYRGDGKLLPFLEYEKISSYKEEIGEDLFKEMIVYRPKSDYRYTYQQSVKDRVNCNIRFKFVNGKVKLKKNGEVHEGTLSEQNPNSKTFSKILRGLYLDEAYIRKAVKEAHSTVLSQRESNPTVKEKPACLVVAKDISTMDFYTPIIQEIFGQAPVVVRGDKSNSVQKIKDFFYSDDWVINSVKMISEGTDIRRLSCLILFCTDSTFTSFVQFLGRIIRMVEGFTGDVVCILPDTTLFRRFAEMFVNDVQPEIRTTEVYSGDSHGLGGGGASSDEIEILESEVFDSLDEFFFPIEVKVTGRKAFAIQSMKADLRSQIKSAVAVAAKNGRGKENSYESINIKANKGTARHFLQLGKISQQKASKLSNYTMNEEQLKYKLKYIKTRI